MRSTCPSATCGEERNLLTPPPRRFDNARQGDTPVGTAPQHRIHRAGPERLAGNLERRQRGRRAGVDAPFGKLADLLGAQKRGFEDDFDRDALRRADDRGDIVTRFGFHAAQILADVDHHVELPGAVADGAHGFVNFDVRAIGAEGKAHDRHRLRAGRAEWRREFFGRERDVARIDADAREPIFQGFAAQLADLLRRGVGL